MGDLHGSAVGGDLDAEGDHSGLPYPSDLNEQVPVPVPAGSDDVLESGTVACQDGVVDDAGERFDGPCVVHGATLPQVRADCTGDSLSSRTVSRSIGVGSQPVAEPFVTRAQWAVVLA